MDTFPCTRVHSSLHRAGHTQPTVIRGASRGLNDIDICTFPLSAACWVSLTAGGGGPYSRSEYGGPYGRRTDIDVVNGDIAAGT